MPLVASLEVDYKTSNMAVEQAVKAMVLVEVTAAPSFASLEV